MSNGKSSKPPATPQAAWRAVNQAVEAKIDPIGMTTPLMHAQLAWLSHPQEMSETLTEFSTKLWELQVHSWHRALGMASKDVVLPNPDDTRFSDPVWSESASWDIVKVQPLTGDEYWFERTRFRRAANSSLPDLYR